LRRQRATTTGPTPYRQDRRPSWFEITWSLKQLRELATSEHLPDEMYIMRWLEHIGVKPRNQNWHKEFAYYPLLDYNAIQGQHLASLALEWDKEGPSNVLDWLEMIEFECAGSPKRDRLREALEAAGESRITRD